MLSEKRIVVIGAGGLLGRRLVEFLVEFPIELLAVDVNKESLNYIELLNEKRNASPIEVEQLDIVDADKTNQFIMQESHFDGLVNCAYPKGEHFGKHFLKQSTNDFNDNVNRHLGSAFSLMQGCARRFQDAAQPLSLVNLASIYGVVAPKFNLYEGTTITMPVEYAAIKAAIIHLTKYFAKGMANSDFRVNCVSPGGVEDSQDESFLVAYKTHCIDKGMLNANDVCGTIAFLLSDYSTAINGQNILVDNGFTL